ncbi:hypothetical protein O1Q96_42245 [Streptomyces sp. Qhu-G9]|uniref:hypothetical protein n=1 Tax=Streptomyces sp. Qhu-G9 TaxID=3452799 RepID=UPI0022AC5F23|nr:hypothetical protein [Streptomyces aurantiacus]WAU85747.1 hypothetical protein O1Q96_42245 [Streptomyces aurantiacus]
MSISKKVAAVGVAAALVSVAGVTQASATEYRGSACDGLFPCISMYFNSNQQGSHSSFAGYGKINFEGYSFASASNGQGQPVKNNAASAYFRAKTSDESAVIYFYSNQAGPCDWLWAQGDKFSIANRLNKTYNENASLKLVDGSLSVGECYQF